MRSPYPITVTLPSGNDGDQCDETSTKGAPDKTIFPTSAGKSAIYQYVSVPDTTAYPSGGFYKIPSTGAVAMTVVDQGKLYWRSLGSSWAAASAVAAANGYLGSESSLISAELGNSIPQGDPLSSVISFVRGPANLAAASCRPGSTIDAIINPIFGSSAARCNASSSYRCVGETVPVGACAPRRRPR